MANVAVYNMEGKEVGKMDLNDDLFGVKINIHGKYASNDDLRKQDGQIIYLIHLVPYTLLT